MKMEILLWYIKFRLFLKFPASSFFARLKRASEKSRAFRFHLSICANIPGAHEPKSHYWVAKP